MILADEPTGALDSQSGKEVMAILRQLCDAGHTVIIVTHDPSIAAQAARIMKSKTDISSATADQSLTRRRKRWLRNQR